MGCPTDEYDRYVGKITSLLKGDASDDALREHLREIEVDYMGLGESAPLRSTETVAAVRALGAPH